ncbi:MAG: Gfo/Idh/MocA family oxidoreductase [Saprospiraceae bacterium]|nr:Gfo/Idh/MocA family oxidoreductase [Saprospiraceae bacterium]
MPVSRRKALKTLGAATGAALLGHFPTGLDSRTPLSFFEENPLYKKPNRAITAITLGAGSRGNVYGGYALEFPEELDIVGVAEPIPIRNERYTQKHNIPEANRFPTWERVFDRPKFADAVIITTPDNLHYGPCMAALKAGYDVLLEKPISPSEQECRDILALAKKTGRIVAVCHVLRYAPYFVKLRELVQSGAIGELISIQHMEPIEHVHMSHSYVRGNWHDRNATTPIILAKSCHDLDILRWLIGKPCKQIVAMGGLKWFRSENAPPGSTARCMDGCAIEGSCPYSAMKIYYRNRSWLHVFDLPDDPAKHGDAILEYLRTTNYGRCVYRMDNNQEDHYVCSMQFDGGVTANFSMEAFTSYAGRRTRVMGSMGDIVGDMDNFTLNDFRTGKSTVYDHSKIVDVENYKNAGHGGGDWRLVRDWIQAVSQQNPALLTSTIDASIESHVMGFMAEQSRKSGKIESIVM